MPIVKVYVPLNPNMVCPICLEIGLQKKGWHYWNGTRKQRWICPECYKETTKPISLELLKEKFVISPENIYRRLKKGAGVA